jgi:hypothetical protein
VKLQLGLTLSSDATFGRGDGVAGLVDEEVEHDPAAGLPFLRGRALKGLLVEECANLFYAMSRQPHLSARVLKDLETAAHFLFGQAGSTLADDAAMHVGAAQLPRELRAAVAVEVVQPAHRRKLTPTEVLESLTAIRRQTSVNDATGAPEPGSLRSMRVILRGTQFVADLVFQDQPSPKALGLLAACVLALRRAGTGRNRGRGRLEARLYDQLGRDITANCFLVFRQLVEGVRS